MHEDQAEIDGLLTRQYQRIVALQRMHADVLAHISGMREELEWDDYVNLHLRAEFIFREMEAAVWRDGRAGADDPRATG